MKKSLRPEEEIQSFMSTIKDVARVAGVGVGTVSRVINNHPGVSPEMRTRVMDVVAQLHYKPNPIARSMISKRTGAVGVIVPFFTHLFQIEVLQSIQIALTRAEKELILYNVETPAQRDHYFSEVPMHQKVDGLLVVSLAPTETFLRRLRENDLPTVLVDAYSPQLSSFVVDNMDGSYKAVKFLLEKGHRRIGFINGIRDDNFTFNQANDRLIGFHRAMSEANLVFDPDLLIAAAWNRHDAQKAALQLLQRHDRPTAIFAASDVQALGVLETARLLQLSIPEELSVMGFDGIELSEVLGLSTVQQPIQQMGELGVAALLKQINDPQSEPKLVRLPTRLIERRTTGSIHL